MLEVVAKAAAIYVAMLLIIRVLGKRTVGNLTAFDMLIALVLGDLAGEAILGESGLASFAAAAGTIAVLHYANSWLAASRPGMARLLEGRPTVIVKDGVIQQPGLRKERMSEADVEAELRVDGVFDLREVRLAQVETDGKLSVLRHDWAEPLRKSDVSPSGAHPSRPKPRRRASADEE